MKFLNNLKNNIRPAKLILFSTLLLFPTCLSALPVTELIKTSITWVGYACYEGEIRDNENAKGFCRGFIEASYNAQSTWCVPSSVTHGEIQDLVKKHLIEKRDKINNLKLPNSLAVNEIQKVIMDEWPCEQSRE